MELGGGEVWVGVVECDVEGEREKIGSKLAGGERTPGVNLREGKESVVCVWVCVRVRVCARTRVCVCVCLCLCLSVVPVGE